MNAMLGVTLKGMEAVPVAGVWDAKGAEVSR